MLFADNIVIFSKGKQQVEKSLERWIYALEHRGMKVSRSKTGVHVYEWKWKGKILVAGGRREEGERVQVLWNNYGK